MHQLNLEIYVTIPLPDILGGDRHLTLAWVNIAPYLPNPLYARKIVLSQEVSLKLPDGTTRVLKISPQDSSLRPNDGYLRLTSNLAFN